MAWDERYRGLTNQLMDRSTSCRACTRRASPAYIGCGVLGYVPCPRGRRGLLESRVLWAALVRHEPHASIMRIATTASPVSGMEVREKTLSRPRRPRSRMLTGSSRCSSPSGTASPAPTPTTDRAQRRSRPCARILYSAGGTKYVDPQRGSSDGIFQEERAEIIKKRQSVQRLRGRRCDTDQHERKDYAGVLHPQWDDDVRQEWRALRARGGS